MVRSPFCLPLTAPGTMSQRSGPGQSLSPSPLLPIASAAVRFGIVPPIVHRNPRFSPPQWEFDADIDDLTVIARAADSLGYDFMSFPGHVAIPESVGDVRGLVYWDPVATMSYIAAHTGHIKLLAYIVVLGYYHPLQIAKSYGT